MPRIHRLTLAVALLSAPILMALAEFFRLRVVGDVPEFEDDAVAGAAAQLDAISTNLGARELHGWLFVIAAIALLGSVIGIVAATAHRQLASLTAGLFGALLVVTLALHTGFHTAMLDLFAASDTSLHDAAAEIYAAEAGGLVIGMVAVYMLAYTFAPLAFATAVWRAGLAPAWVVYGGAVLWIVGDFVATGGPVSALRVLPLLLIFVPVARALTASNDRSAMAHAAV